MAAQTTAVGQASIIPSSRFESAFMCFNAYKRGLGKRANSPTTERCHPGKRWARSVFQVANYTPGATSMIHHTLLLMYSARYARIRGANKEEDCSTVPFLEELETEPTRDLLQTVSLMPFSNAEPKALCSGTSLIYGSEVSPRSHYPPRYSDPHPARWATTRPPSDASFAHKTQRSSLAVRCRLV